MMYNTRIDIFKKLNNNSIVCEIGVFKGDFSSEIIKTNPKEIHLVDIFNGKCHSGDKDGLNVIHIDDMNSVYHNLKKIYKSKNNIKIIKNTSSNYLKTLPDNYFDIIYIDGNHSYKNVIVDLELSRLKIKKNGYITGHDYHPDIGGVKLAVDYFCKKYNLKFELTTNDILPSFIIKNLK